MAIEKRFIHFKKFSDFNSKKLSANEANTQYTVGVSGAIQNGEPDILYQSYIWIKDTKQQWTHGQLYDGTNLNEAGFLAGEETSDQLDDVETHTYVKYVPQTLTDEQKAQVRENIGVVEGGKEIIANKQEVDSRFVFANDSDNGPLEPNKIYVSHFTVVFGIHIYDIIPPTDLYAEYTIIFKTGGSVDYEGELVLPSYVLWANGTTPTLEAQTNYELSISATKIDDEYVYKAVLVPFKPVS